ncbi:MAG: hypothetical protein HOO67_00260 [Candidatus Peribacteraceae bacterium]|nr:hypothetical protein [Candidatus Peribacteraceae bacterium]
MNRLATLTLAGALLLSSCRRAGDLPSEDVLRLATVQSNQLQSAEYDAELHAEIRRGPVMMTGDATLRGVLAHAGRQASFTVEANGTLTGAAGPTTFRLSGDVVRDALDTYVLFREFSTDPAVPALQGTGSMFGTWRSLPRGAQSSPVPQLTPDPLFLRAQSEVVTVIDDHGLEDINGADAYHYGVVIDHDRLVNLMTSLAEEQGQPFDAEKTRRELQAYDARGELWIDAETFVVHRLEWTVTSKEQPAETLLKLRMNLHSHDAAPPVTIPVDAQPLGQNALVDTFMNNLPTLIHGR